MSGFDFVLNGSPVHVDGESVNQNLLEFLRRRGCTGSKQGCNEGDCGACTVIVTDRAPGGPARYRAVNSCLALLPSLAGKEVLTVEGLHRDGALHPVQSCMVEQYGSQCGYCTPGFVMAMFEGYYREDLDAVPWKAGEQLCGNLCRCTGYRPIREAMLQALNMRDESGNDPWKQRLQSAAEADVPMRVEGLDGEYFLPSTLEELLELKRLHPEAILVGGATEIGVEINKKFRKFPRLIATAGVRDLQHLEERNDGWMVGGAVTLSALEEKVGPQIPAMAKMLRVFASRQIRNRATLAGNVATASPIGDMPPLLLALDAVVHLLSTSGKERAVPIADFFVAYRKTALASEEIIRSIWIPRPPATAQLESFKVSKRRELEISSVAAVFRLETEADGTVKLARLAYGGVAAMPLRAVEAENYLIGKIPDAATARAVSKILSRTFEPITDVRASAEYRNMLVTGLWEKFVSGERSEAQDLDLDFVVTEPWADAEEHCALKHESAIGHVTGRANYVHDTALVQGPMLEIFPVLSQHAAGRLVSLDIAPALAMPGIVAVLTAADVPGVNDIGASVQDEPLFATDKVFYHGQPLALVVGETVEACRLAATAVVVHIEPAPPVLGAKEAVRLGHFHTEATFMRRGDAGKGLEQSEYRITGEFEFGGQEHFYLETQAAWAVPNGEDGLTVWSSTQHPSEIQEVLSHVLHLSRNKIDVRAPRMGGGFGGKETQGNLWAAFCALAALKTGRPARVQADRDVDMVVTGKRHPFFVRYEAGFDGQGMWKALRAELFSDGGWSLDLSMPVTDRALFHIDNAYFIPDIEVSGRVAKTNVASNTAFRGFGGPQGMLVCEEIMDRIARELGIAPEIVRERNFYREGADTTHYGQNVGEPRIARIWRELLESSQFAERRKSIDTWNTGSPHIKRGLAVTPVKFGISFTLSHYNQAGALVLIYTDGTVQVNHGGTEMGQGLQTKILGIAMRELGLSAGRIRLMCTATDKIPNTSATAASCGSDLNGAAVADACRTLLGRMRPVAAELLGVREEEVSFKKDAASANGNRVSFEEVAARAHQNRVSLAATGYYRTPDIHWDRAKGQGHPFSYFAWGAAVCEVEVDGFTGMNRMRRVDILHDAGTSLNPGVDRGQIEGGFLQGAGWLTREQLKWDTEGRLLTHGASTYAIPAIGDAPADFRVSLLKDAGNLFAIHGSKAVGEPPLMLAISVREALRDAVGAFGKAGGRVVLESPATNEAVLKAVAACLEAR